MSRSLTVILISALLAAVTFFVYWPTLDHGFVTFYDDQEYVTENPHVQAGPTTEALVWAFTTTHSANWHPVTWISHMLDCRFYGLNPVGHHLTNLLLHIASTILLLLVLTRATGFIWRSAFVAALFAVHPLHVESVAWIAERKDVLSAFFWMLTMWAYVRYAARPGLARYALVASALALGLMCKPMLVTLPLVLLLLDYWPLARLKPGMPVTKLVLEKVPLLALSAASSVATFIAQQSAGAVNTIGELSLRARVMNALVSYVKYIAKMIWPSGLATSYPHPGEAIPAWQAVGAGLLLIAITALAMRAARRSPYLTTGWLWYLVTLIPVIGLVQVGSRAMADRYAYIPLIGLFIAISWGVSESVGVWGCGSMGERKSPTRPFPHSPILFVLALIVVLVLAVSARRQTGYWRNSITLLTRAVEVTPTDYSSLDVLGSALAAEGRFDEAVKSHEAAISLAPNAAFLRNGFALTLFKRGRDSEAIREFHEALRLDPRFPEAHFNLARALSLNGQLGDAAAHYRECLKLRPRNARAHNNLGNVFLKQGKLADAANEFRAALEIDPGYAQARTNLSAAEADLRSVREGKPRAGSSESASAHYNLGVKLQTQDRVDDAIREYREALRLRPTFAEAHNNLALALFDKGQYSEAWKEVHTCRKLGLDPHPGFVDALRSKMPEPAN